MLTDTKSGPMRIALHQIYVSIYVEYVVKNPLSPIEHPGGLGVNNELFEITLQQYVVGFTGTNNLCCVTFVYLTAHTSAGSSAQRFVLIQPSCHFENLLSLSRRLSEVLSSPCSFYATRLAKRITFYPLSATPAKSNGTTLSV